MGPSMNRHCAQCGGVNTDVSPFCALCGASLSENEARAQPQLTYASGLSSQPAARMQTTPISLADLETDSTNDMWTEGGGMQQQQQQMYEKVAVQRTAKRGLLSRRELFIGLGGVVTAGGLLLGYNFLRAAPVQPQPAQQPALLIPTPLGANSHLAPAENFSAAWSAQGRYLGCASAAGTLLIKDAASNTILVNDTTNAINDLIWSPINVGDLALACDDATVQIRQIPADSITQVYREHDNPVLALSWAHDGKYIASVDEGPVVNVWNAATLETRLSYSTIFNGQVTSLSWSPDGKQLVCGGADSTVSVLDVSKHQPLLTYTHHEQAVEAVSWSPDGRFIASAGDDATVQIWQPQHNEISALYTGHSDKVWCLAWSPDSQFVASGSWDKTVRIWRLFQYPQSGPQPAETSARPPSAPPLQKIYQGKPYRVFTQHQDRVVALDWSTSGRIVSIDASGNILLWSLND